MNLNNKLHLKKDELGNSFNYRVTTADALKRINFPPSSGPNSFEFLSAQIKKQVHESVFALIQRDFTFEGILKDSGVSQAFLEETFKDLGLNPTVSAARKPEWKINKKRLRCAEIAVGSFKEHKGKSSANKNIEFEMRLLSLRLQTEMKRFEALLEDNEFSEQLLDKSTCDNLFAEKDLIVGAFDRLFDKISLTANESAKFQSRELAGGSRNVRRDVLKVTSENTTSNTTISSDQRDDLVTSAEEQHKKKESIMVCFSQIGLKCEPSIYCRIID